VRTHINNRRCISLAWFHRACETRGLLLLIALLCTVAGCEPSLRELENRRELEALLTAVSLKSKKELAVDVKRIDGRHNSGGLSDASYHDLQEIIRKAEAGDWAGAEKQAYELREAKPYFQ
jgi:hypothetical protein